MNIARQKSKRIGLRRLPFGSLKPETRQGYTLVCVALWSTIAFLFIHRFVVSAVVVDGRSMMPTLSPGNRCLVNSWLPYFREYKRGDLVVVRDHARGEMMVKRIIGLPRDRVQFLNGKVLVNSQCLKEPYVPKGAYTYSRQLGSREIKVAANAYFVMGDNRLYSEDSRAYGDVDRGDIVGLISQ